MTTEETKPDAMVRVGSGEGEAVGWWRLET